MGRVCSVLMPVVTLQSFKDRDWPSGSPLIGAWSMTWHQLDKIVKNWHQPVKLQFFDPNSTSDVPDRFNRSISRSPVNFKKIGEGHIFAISRDLVT